MREARRPGADEGKRLQQTVLSRTLKREIGSEMSVLLSSSYFVFVLEDPNRELGTPPLHSGVLGSDI